jgi:hypothetical protein
MTYCLDPLRTNTLSHGQHGQLYFLMTRTRCRWADQQLLPAHSTCTPQAIAPMGVVARRPGVILNT